MNDRERVVITVHNIGISRLSAYFIRNGSPPPFGIDVVGPLCGKFAMRFHDRTSGVITEFLLHGLSADMQELEMLDDFAPTNKVFEVVSFTEWPPLLTYEVK